MPDNKNYKINNYRQFYIYNEGLNTTNLFI